MNEPEASGADGASVPVDLSGVDPVHWAETRERVRILRDWVAGGRHTRMEGEAAAARMGVSVAHFYRLVATWKKHRDARLVSGQSALRGEPRARRSVTTAARAGVDAAIARLGADARYVDVLAAVRAACVSADISAPSAGTIHNILMRARRSDGSSAQAPREDVAVASVAVLLPVEIDGIVIDAPDLVLAVERPGGRILHHRLVVDGDRTAVASDMLVALSTVDDAPIIVAPSLAAAVIGKSEPRQSTRASVAKHATLLTRALGDAIDNLPIRHRPHARRATAPWRPLSQDDAVAAIDMAVAAHNAARRG